MAHAHCHLSFFVSIKHPNFPGARLDCGWFDASSASSNGHHSHLHHGLRKPVLCRSDVCICHIVAVLRSVLLISSFPWHGGPVRSSPREGPHTRNGKCPERF